jgi:hypothetical protein
MSRLQLSGIRWFDTSAYACLVADEGQDLRIRRISGIAATSVCSSADRSIAVGDPEPSPVRGAALASSLHPRLGQRELDRTAVRRVWKS